MYNQPETDTDLFDEAFAEEAAVTPPTEELVVDEPGATEGDAPGAGTDAAPPAEGTDAPASADGTQKAEGTEVPEQAPATTEAPPPATPDYGRQTVELLDQLVKKGTSPGPADAAQPNAQPPATSQDQGGAEPEPFTLSAEQTALLKAFDDEWPEVAKASALRTEMAVRTAVGALMKQLRTELAPIVTHYAKSAGDSHLGTIRAAHNDFDTLKPKVLEWIDKQPPGFRSALTGIAKGGSAEDVVELLNLYKKANGIGTPAAVAESADASVIPPKKPAPEVAKAAASLAVIPGRRSVVPKGGVDKNDFDAAWSAATGS